ncbi:M48 family metallopeptidase [Roseofilum casamattae]|uniref:M48 family metallopeptidase n=1 Tax=Roseofilum casamattae BLCC-M143 TaxID=3022442 RepID=A0ABT7BXZ4_9CYAN|nr:M48 family metallopeptidase [Roseofilum casamattae]MDJ1184061.1 M48 family metallopeptidase [Roseofilum casamattae BLCC-M143]
MSQKNPPPSNRELLILLGIAVAAIAVIVWGFFAIADFAIMQIPVSVEQKLGALVVPAYEQQAKDSIQQDSLNQLLDRLETHLDDGERNYRLFYVDEPTVNAIAIPGDVIVIFAGLLESVESENELMMVLGHELGHFAHRDHLRRLGRTLAVRMAIATVFGNVDWLNNAGGIIAAVSNARYSQGQEQNADRFGLKLLYQTYGHVAGATDFFARLSEERNQNWAFLASHPAPQKRVATLEKKIKQDQYPIRAKVPLPASLQYQN